MALNKYYNIPKTVKILNTQEAEADEIWSYVGNKKNQRWLWHAIYHKTGLTLAYILANYCDESLSKLKSLLRSFSIRHFYTYGWGGYKRHIPANNLTIGKNTQKIKKNHLTLRTRIKRLTRKTTYFSKSEKCMILSLECSLIDINFLCKFNTINQVQPITLVSAIKMKAMAGEAHVKKVLIEKY